MVFDKNVRTQLREQVEQADMALALKKPSANVEQWAKANLHYAIVSSALGREEEDQAALEHYRNAIDAFENALSFYNENHDLTEWCSINIALIKTLRAYGQREGGQAGLLKLRQAQKRLGHVYTAPLPEGQDTLSKTMLQLEYGYTLRALSELDTQDHKQLYLKKAIALFHDVMLTFRHKEQFELWANTLVTLAMSYNALSQLQNDSNTTTNLNTAIDFLKTALEYYDSQNKIPEHMLATSEIARAYIMLSQQQNNQKQRNALHSAATALQLIHDKYAAQLSHEALSRLKTDWASTLFLLAQCSMVDEASTFLDQSIRLHNDNIKLFKLKNDTQSVALTMGYLGKDLSLYANIVEEEQSPYYRKQAIEALRQAHPDTLQQTHPMEWLSNFIELGAALHALGYTEEGQQRLERYQEASQIYQQALKAFTKDQDPTLWMKLQQWLGLAHAYIGEGSEQQTSFHHLKQAEKSFHQALSILDDKKNPLEYIKLQDNISRLLFTLAQHPSNQDTIATLMAAQRATQDALKRLDKKNMAEEWADIKLHSGLILWHIAKCHESPEPFFIKAHHTIKQALDVYTGHDDKIMPIRITITLARMYIEWGNSGHATAGALNHLQTAANLLRSVISLAAQSQYDEEVQQATHDYNKACDLIRAKQTRWQRFKAFFALKNS